MAGQAQSRFPEAAAGDLSAKPGIAQSPFAPGADLARALAAQPPLSLREVSAVALLVALCDATIYRGAGFAGLALLLCLAPGLLAIGTPRPMLRTGFWIVVGMTLLLAARMAWLGSAWMIAVGLALL